MNPAVNRTPDRITFRELTEVLWQQRWLVLIATVIFTAATAAASIVLPKKFTAVVVVSPVSESPGGIGSSGVGSLVSQMSGLASFAGLVSPGGDEKAEYVAILQSEGLTERFIKENNLLPILARSSRKVTSLWKANEYFRDKIRQVTTDSKSGLVSLSITWSDPQLAARWANSLVELTNDYIRGKAISESQRNIDYLNEQAMKTEVVEVKVGIYSLLEQEIKKQMLAKGSDEYALKIIDPAVAPERVTSPRPIAWTVGAFLGCVTAAVLLGLCLLAWRNS